MSAILDLIAAWRAGGVRLEPPATDLELRSLESALGTELPADVREFYLHANGMPDLEYDAHEMSFWSIAKVVTESERSGGQDAKGSFSDLAIGDFLINSWFPSLRVRGETVCLFLNGSGEEFPDLSSFAARYLAAPKSLPVL